MSPEIDRRTHWLIAALAVVILCLVLLLVPGGAQSEEPIERPERPTIVLDELMAEREKPPPPGRRWFTPEDAEPGSAEAVKGRRPLDDSDPEMRVLAEEFFEQPACNRGPGKRCPQAKAPLQAGGDRLASYLIVQHERSRDEGYQDTATLLTAIAATESQTGEEYISGLVDRPRDDREFDFALSALKECASDRCVDKALDVLARTPERESRVRAKALRALQVNITEGKLSRPDAVAQIQASAERETTTEDEKRAARGALKALGQ